LDTESASNEKSQSSQKSDLVKLYEDGKHRRYEMLFLVNGGAFAIAKLMLDKSNPSHVLGKLTLTRLSIGMAVFTAIMVYDICSFGRKMRKQMQELLKREDVDMFSREGKAVLGAIGALIIAGWICAGWR
jgi:hypothetical protein